ncbi:hypothetical protein [Clostridium algidicarnis]|uniref:hypothetical protein n=1 Tax=Clostridium algidicarnis TaxID=37659 RepID=UPI003FD8605C
MSKSKKLDLPIEKLKEISQAINENTLANRSKCKEDKIPTDKFIRQFEINRKDFSETIKDTNIKYNKSTFFYDIKGSEEVPFSTTGLNLNQVNKSNSKVNLPKALGKTTQSTSTETQSPPNNTLQLPNEFKELLSLTGELKEMVGWYRNQTNTNIIEVPDINVNTPKLSGEIITRSFKMYKKIAEDFSIFADGRKETQKDLISLALLEFIQKYK